MNWLKRRITKFLIGALKEKLQEWIDDPETDTDQNAVDSVGNYLEYLVTK